MAAHNNMIKIENGLVAVKDLKAHPLNEKLYPLKDHGKNIELLAKKLYDEFLETGVPNHTPIDICPETGTINSGHFRKYGSQKMKDDNGNLVECTHLRAVYGREFNPDYVEYDEIKHLEKFNKDGKRDEYTTTTLVHNYNVQNKAFEKKYGREFSARERNEFAVDSRIDKDKFRKIMILNHDHPDIYEKFIDGTWTIGKCWRKAGKVKSTKKFNKDRHNFFKTLDENPEIIENFKKVFKQTITDFRNIGNGIILKDGTNWELNQLSGAVSNIAMSSAVEAFNSLDIVDLKCTTPENQQGYADIHFENLTNKFSDEFLSERIEVKMGSWQGSCSLTKITGGMGSVKVSPHEYLIGVWNAQLQKYFIVLTTLDKDDWITNSADAKPTMTLSAWFNRYYHQKDKWRPVMGNIYKGNKSIEIDWEGI